ncbi:tyrosine-type recombinase/integrase [Streptomyces sp. NPDC086777]|uniref:tyrosine-type recombinase/integrase n=1 Tax=Streptomyces sp. NPDC086777 TaxID=3154866 RepID=UPI00344B9845
MGERLGGNRTRLDQGERRDVPPANVTRRFVELGEETGLPPIRLHDLRHGAATLAHAADLKDIQEMLGHSSVTTTADTYEPAP